MRHPSDGELLQALLGLAFTIQQEAPHSQAQVDAPAGYGQHPALERIATFAQNATEANGAAIALGDARGMVCVARSGMSAPPVGAEFDASDGLSGECIRLGQPVVCVNAAADPRVNYQACRGLNIASLLYVPLYSSQKTLIGILGVFSPQPLHFSQRDISCLRPVEQLVQEALGATAEDPDPATLGTLLRQAGIEAPEKIEPVESPAATVLDLPLMPLPMPGVRRQIASPVEPPVPKRPPDPPRPKVDAIFVGRLVDDAVVDEPVRRDEKSEEESEGRSRFPVVLVVLVMLLVASAAYKYNAAIRLQRQNKIVVTKSVAAPSPLQPAPATPEPATPRRLTEAVSMVPTESGVVIHIDLPKAIRYEGYQIDHPDRVYFDLHDVRLSDDKGSEFKQPDGLVSGVRLFTYGNGVTRIVFDLRHPASFAAKLEENPARLTIELKRVGDASKTSESDPQAKLDLHTGANSP